MQYNFRLKMCSEAAMKATQMPQLGGWRRITMKTEFPTHPIMLGPYESEAWTMGETDQQI